jgi:putative mRNA 3-end processing factor
MSATNKQYQHTNELIQFTDKGLYCTKGDFYIDPWKPVDKAVITHAHSDHARWGSKYYLCHHLSKPLLQLRLGNNNYQSIEWNESVYINGVQISLHPSGHIIGASQVRIEHQGEIWVISGDYKLENDGISTAFEPIACHHFITESTFGLPIYHWQPQHQIYASISKWIQQNQQDAQASVLIAYSLGKAQRVLQAAATVTDNIFVHGAIWNTQEVLQAAGFQFPAVKKITPDTPKELLKTAVVIAPPSAEDSLWMKRFSPYKTGICSGWMQVRGNSRRQNADAGFVLSDHADWNGLLCAVQATKAQRVFVTHGFQAVFSRYLNELGIESHEVSTAYGEAHETDEPLNDVIA